MIQPLLVFSDWAILILRVVLGIILVVHGLPKVRAWANTSQMFAKMGFKPASFWLGTVTALELVGGIFLIAGFLTQIIALLVALQFLIIIFVKAKRRQGLIKEFELDLLIFASAILLAAIGGGTYGIDALIGIIVY